MNTVAEKTPEQALWEDQYLRFKELYIRFVRRLSYSTDTFADYHFSHLQERLNDIVTTAFGEDFDQYILGTPLTRPDLESCTSEVFEAQIQELQTLDNRIASHCKSLKLADRATGSELEIGRAVTHLRSQFNEQCHQALAPESDARLEWVRRVEVISELYGVFLSMRNDLLDKRDPLGDLLWRTWSKNFDDLVTRLGPNCRDFALYHALNGSTLRHKNRPVFGADADFDWIKGRLTDLIARASEHIPQSQIQSFRMRAQIDARDAVLRGLNDNY